MQTQTQMFVKRRNKIISGLSEWWRMNWTSVRRRYIKSSMKIYGRGGSAQHSQMSRSNGDSHHAKASSRLGQDSLKFLGCIFHFPKAITALKVKRFQNAEQKRDGRIERVSLQAFPGCFQNLFKRFNKWAQITLNKNTTIFYFLVFLFFFSQQSGNFIARPRTYIHIYIL
jgi:hypothetical protein